MSVAPELHASLLGGASIAALVFSAIILARNPQSTPARLHAVYGGVGAWWFFCMAMIATSAGPDQVQLWGRLVHLSLGMLPGVMFHLNVATAGLAHEHRRGIRVHYGFSVAVTLFCVAWPDLLGAPHRYPWGPYLSYTAWGLITPGFLLVVFAEVLGIYRDAQKRAERGTAYHEKARAFFHGNAVAMLAMVDFLPVFGFAVYPFGFAIMTAMHVATVFGSIRYRLIEITPEFAAEQILSTLPDGVFAVDSQGLIRLANEAAARTFDRDVRDLVDQPLASVVADPRMLDALSPPSSSTPAVREIAFASGDDPQRIIRLSGALLRDQKNAPVARVWVLHDLTEQRIAEAEKDKLEGWVRHGQKLETLGVMAGGIAHDFNNLLMAILGGADVATARLADGLPVDEQLRAIMSAAERAAELTNQMLTYAGQGPTLESPVDLNALSRDIAELMRTAISKKAKLELLFDERLPRVIADKSQMSQILLNLITNASDALGDSPGSITLRTGTLQAGMAEGDLPEASIEHVFVEVADTGIGMDPETKGRIFDPFFTTKFAGRGLGLAAVMGIVRAHGGRIRVDTAPGRGTRFTVALPAATEARSDAIVTEAGALDWKGSGVALLVDDELEARVAAGQMLAHARFEVAEAVDGEEAVAVFRDRRSAISLVLLDITMPEMDGREAFFAIRALSPEVPIILMSGYTDAVIADLIHEPRTSFLSKPFRFSALAGALREVMAEDDPPAHAGAS